MFFSLVFFSFIFLFNGIVSSNISQNALTPPAVHVKNIIKTIDVKGLNNPPISFFKLESNNFTEIGKKLSKLRIPTLFVMEGGYSIKEIGVNTVNTLEGFENG